MEGQQKLADPTRCVPLTCASPQPIYLPCWQMDFSLTIQARLEGDDHSLVLTAVDIPFCGAGPEVAPLGTSGHGFWPMSSITADLQDYDPAKHTDVFQPCDVPEGEPVPSAQPMAFTLGPQDVLGHVNKALADVRNEEVRFPGGNKTTLFAAYPYYAPMFLVEGRDRKVEGGSSVSGPVSSLKRCLRSSSQSLPRSPRSMLAVRM